MPRRGNYACANTSTIVEAVRDAVTAASCQYSSVATLSERTVACRSRALLGRHQSMQTWKVEHPPTGTGLVTLQPSISTNAFAEKSIGAPTQPLLIPKVEDRRMIEFVMMPGSGLAPRKLTAARLMPSAQEKLTPVVVCPAYSMVM